MFLDKYKDIVIDLYCNGGYSAVGISRLFNVSNKTVTNSLKHWGIESKNYNLYSKVYIPSDVLTGLYKSGKTQAEIATIFSCSTSSIRRRLRRLEIIRNDPNGSIYKSTKIDQKLSKFRVIDMYIVNKLSCKEIADIFGVSNSIIYKKLKTWGVDLRNFSDCNLVKYTNGAHINKNSKYGKGSYYNTPYQGKRWMRSTWEVFVAAHLTSLGIVWYYEHHFVLLNNGEKYLPDFYLPVEKKYIEVKGIKNFNTLRKFKIAAENYNIELWDGFKLQELGIINDSHFRHRGQIDE